MHEGSSGRPTVMNLIGGILDDRYQILSLLGEGGMGAVYRATHLPDGRTVAVKVLLEELGDQPEIRERFEREARALFGLSHAHILTVHDFGLTSGRPYLVMDLLEGETLDAMLEEGPLPIDTAVALFRQFLSGLAHAHGQGALHRDLKTENVHVGTAEQRHVTILDFGLVKFTDDDRWGNSNKLTVMGSVFGTPAYMAPEQCTGGQTDKRTDVYASGAILFELLTGEWPFMEESRLEMFKAHLTAPPPSVAERGTSAHLSNAEPEFDAFIAKAMNKIPDERFADGAEMLQALEGLAATRQSRLQGGAAPVGLSPTTPQTPTNAPDAGSALPSWLWVAVAGIVLALAAGAFLLM